MVKPNGKLKHSAEINSDGEEKKKKTIKNMEPHFSYRAGMVIFI